MTTKYCALCTLRLDPCNGLCAAWLAVSLNHPWGLGSRWGFSKQTHPPLALRTSAKTKIAGRTGGEGAISDWIFDLYVSGAQSVEHGTCIAGRQRKSMECRGWAPVPRNRSVENPWPSADEEAMGGEPRLRGPEPWGCL